ncbi:MAG: Asp-tRNA(Asn)/Glu-tRNA(Gln) amidotransferase subunit GatB [Rhodothermales bacterium]|nr:Asp-tRNA(Asn)/Glu-tRNA(Gln) amidotransferase subunit GatB [Rhodothermales bacterium]
MRKFETVIGLEIHIQLDTASRLFSAEPTHARASVERPNSLSGPYALGHPGTYPVLNGRAVRSAVRLGLALGCRINGISGFDRKHYFYPDLPRGYQITQHRTPVCGPGEYIPADDPHRGLVRIRSIHIEEDAGRLVHHADRTLVDYDRSGVPLLELVTEPDFGSPGNAADFLRDLRDIVRTLDIGDGRMEEGSIRCDANISIRPVNGRGGARVEIKNMNSFSHVEQGLTFEAERQANLVDADGRVQEETRRFDADLGGTVPMRSKESAPDYRFIPEPDLPPVRVTPAEIRTIEADMPERPDRRRQRLRDEHGLPSDWARMLAARPAAADRLDETRQIIAARGGGDAGRIAELTWRAAAVLVEDVLTDGRPMPTPSALADLADLVQDRRILSSSTGKLLEMIDPQQMAEASTLERLAESEGLLLTPAPESVEPVIQEVIREHPDEWRRYVSGKDGLLGYFVGRVLGALKSPTDPAIVSALIEGRREAERASDADGEQASGPA